MLELDHASDGRARDHSVVESRVSLAVELHFERRQLDRAVLAGEHAPEPALELVARDRREEADTPEVDADHRDARAEEARERA